MSGEGKETVVNSGESFLSSQEREKAVHEGTGWGYNDPEGISNARLARKRKRIPLVCSEKEEKKARNVSTLHKRRRDFPSAW